MEELFVRAVGTNPVMQAFAGGLVIAFLNLVGAVSIYLMRNPTQRLLTGALGFSAGVMLGASFTSLILPGIEIGGLVPVMIGVLLGTVFLDRSDAWVPHAHILVTGCVRRDQNPESTAMVEGSVLNQRFSALVLFIVAIGLPCAVGFAAGVIALWHQRRDHPGNTCQGPRAGGDVRHDHRRDHHGLARRAAGVGNGSAPSGHPCRARAVGGIVGAVTQTGPRAFRPLRFLP